MQQKVSLKAEKVAVKILSGKGTIMEKNGMVNAGTEELSVVSVWLILCRLTHTDRHTHMHTNTSTLVLTHLFSM